MELDSKSKQADAIGNLYRSALFMVKGETDLSFSFLEKAHCILKEKISSSLVEFLTKKECLSKEQQLLWAEKILDQYHKFKSTVL